MRIGARVRIANNESSFFNRLGTIVGVIDSECEVIFDGEWEMLTFVEHELEEIERGAITAEYIGQAGYSWGSPHIEMKYKNWRGETAIREVRPISISYYSGGTGYHPQPGWFFHGFDIEKQEERTFALADCDFRMRGTLQDAWEAVREFHIAFGHPAPEKPSAQTFWEHDNERRYRWILSECDELLTAVNITEAADAYLDIIYFALGGLVELGIEPSKIFDMVHAANMAKLHPDGKPRYDETGKVIKPKDWESPDDKIAAHIEELTK